MGAVQEESGLRVVDAKVSFDVHPCYAGNVRAGVRERLTSMLMKGNEMLPGVPLAFADVSIQGSKARILDGLSPYFKVHLALRWLVFAPTIGTALVGQVNNVADTYIGFVVLGSVNGSIAEANMGAFSCDLEAGPVPEWVDRESEGRHRIRVGSMIRFVVRGVHEANDGHMNIEGTLDAPRTGAIDWLARKAKREPVMEREPAPLANGVSGKGRSAGRKVKRESRDVGEVGEPATGEKRRTKKIKQKV